MGRKRRYRPVLSDKETRSLLREVGEAVGKYTRRLQERQQAFLKLLKERGPERFTWWLARRTLSEGSDEFAPDPRFYPELREKLEHLRDSGYSVDDDVRVSRVGGDLEPPRLRIELPLNADLREYLPAMQAYQEYFKSLQDPQFIPRYLADEHGRSRTYSELAAELNEALIAWSKGETIDPALEAFFKRKGYTPDDYEEYNEERVRRIVKHFWTKK